MALYYNLVFSVLVVEMVFFGILSLPYPRRIRRSVLATVSMPFRSEQTQIAIKCLFVFVLILFVDSVNRVTSVTSELHNLDSPMKGVLGVDRSEVQARRFYAQRNMYLCGFTLFLTVVLTRTYSLVAELIVTKDKLDDLKTAPKGESLVLAALQEELAEKEKQAELLKEQAQSLSKEYDAVSK